MFNKETHEHTYMSDKAAKLLARSNEKIARERLEQAKKAASDKLRNNLRAAELSSSAYQERQAREYEADKSYKAEMARLEAEERMKLMSNPEVYKMHLEAEMRKAEMEREDKLRKEAEQKEFLRAYFKWVGIGAVVIFVVAIIAAALGF